MHHAVMIFPTEYAMPPAELAVEVESRGFESLWSAEHSHIPASRLSPWPGGAELPQGLCEDCQRLGTACSVHAPPADERPDADKPSVGASVCGCRLGVCNVCKGGDNQRKRHTDLTDGMSLRAGRSP